MVRTGGKSMKLDDSESGSEDGEAARTDREVKKDGSGGSFVKQKKADRSDSSGDSFVKQKKADRSDGSGGSFVKNKKADGSGGSIVKNKQLQEQKAMGTKSIIKVLDERRKLLLAFYIGNDSHPQYLGKDIANFLQGALNGQETQGGTFNGMPDLAAQLLTHITMQRAAAHARGSMWGNVSIVPERAACCSDCELHYIIFPNLPYMCECKTWDLSSQPYTIAMSVETNDATVLFEGPVSDYDAKKVDEAWQGS